jgi:hypothetical protein
MILMVSGENIFNLIDHELEKRGIPWENCIAMGSDNANVMVGAKKGVIEFCRQKNPNLFLSGCCLHLVHIYAKKDAANLPPIEKVLVAVQNLP